jgi:hypothetical protein
MTSNPDLTGRVAVVTGAARGVGLALALHAADRGMMVALADIDEYMLAAAVEQVREKNVKAIAVHTDMLDFAAVRDCLSAVEDISSTSSPRSCSAFQRQPYVAAMHATVSLSEGLYRELDSMGGSGGRSEVGLPCTSQDTDRCSRKSESRSIHDARCSAEGPVTRRDCRGGLHRCRHTALPGMSQCTCTVWMPVAAGREWPERGIRSLGPG